MTEHEALLEAKYQLEELLLKTNECLMDEKNKKEICTRIEELELALADITLILQRLRKIIEGEGNGIW
jgi:hypothetical protein